MPISNIQINEETIAFISDWKKRTDKHQKRFFTISIGVALLASIACIATFFWFQNENYIRIVQQNMNYIQDSTIQETNQVEKEMNSSKKLIENLAKQYTTLCKTSPELSIRERVALIEDKSIFDYIVFISEEGIDQTSKGSIDVSGRNYFRNAMKGMTGWESITQSLFTGKPSVVFYAPVNVDGKIIGAMLGYYEEKKLDTLFSSQIFNYNSDTYLLTKSGVPIANSNERLPDYNMLLRLSSKRFSGEIEYDDIVRIINDDSRTIVSFNYMDGKQTKVACIVQFNNSENMLLSILPGEVTTKMLKKVNTLGRIMLFAIAFIFIMVISIMVLIFKKQRTSLEHELVIAIDSLKSTADKDKIQISIIEALVNTYASVYYIDLESLTYTRIKEDEATSEREIPQTGDVLKGFAHYVDKFVIDADKEAMCKFTDISTFEERISKDQYTSIEYRRADKCWRRGRLVPINYDEKSLKSVVFAVQRIDEEKRAQLQTKIALQEAYEAAQLASDAKTSFLSNMSHDIRTPMNAIIGMTAIAAANIDNAEKVNDCLKKISTSSKHLLGLINEVLDMSKIESGKIDLVDDYFSLSDMVDNVISMHKSLIEEKHHALSVKTINVEHENLIGDCTRLQQVFTNVFSNAIKYTPDNGRIEVIVTEKPNNKPNIGWFEISVIDNGIGMSEEYLERIFEPFFRADDTRITNIQGTGLGMPIAKNIVQMMNGEIKVNSEINKGTDFTFSFVMKLQEDNGYNENDFVDLPVLVVDDDIIACESTCEILNSLEMNSEYVTSGREAVEKTVEHHKNDDDYYAVIVDWKMPEMNGIETARTIRKNVGYDVPIIVISAYDWSEIEQEARDAGVNAFLTKPVFKSRIASVFHDLVSTTDTDNSSTAVTEEKPKDESSFDGKRVLLVEDNEINSEITVELLSMIGIETEVAENGQIGVDKFNASPQGYYDIIFMDIQMPVMNGYQATEAIRKLSRPDAEEIPIVAMTANAFTTDIRNAYDSGMNGHISKPVDLNRIVEVLNECIK